MKQLRSMANPKNVVGMARFGITGREVLGISIKDLRLLAKEIKDAEPKAKKSEAMHELALKLFNTGIREAKILASYIDDPAKVLESQLDKWVNELESWDEVDQVCGLFIKSSFSLKKILEWVKREEEFVKRTPFSMIACISIRDKKKPDKEFDLFFKLIKEHSIDNRNYVRKAVNWALRNIGKRNKNLNKEAIKVAEQLSLSSDKTARWIGKHALKELTSEKFQNRLKKRSL